MAIHDENGGMNARWMNVLVQIATGLAPIERFEGRLDEEDMEFIEEMKREIEAADAEGRFANITIPDF